MLEYIPPEFLIERGREHAQDETIRSTQEEVFFIKN